MVLLQDVVEILDLPDRDQAPSPGEFQDHIHALKAGQIGTAFVNHNPVWHTVCANGLFK
jgi:hypothetical protein